MTYRIDLLMKNDPKPAVWVKGKELTGPISDGEALYRRLKNSKPEGVIGQRLVTIKEHVWEASVPAGFDHKDGINE